MALLTGRNRTYLLLGMLLAAVVIVAVWTAMAAADSPATGGTESPEAMTQPGGQGGHGIPYEGPSGIWVSGTGKASAAPDLAVVSLGVEAEADTAAEARASAAAAMTSVIEALKDAGVADADIQTRHFNISPRYQHVEIERCDEDDGGSAGMGAVNTEGEQEETSEKICYTVWENRLTGYSVSNQATVNVRNLDNTGSIIDEVAESAGDLVRINGVSFQIEDSQALEDQARTNAVSDLLRKAQMLAELSGVKLGSLVYLNEGSSYSPPQPLYARGESLQFDSASAITPISGGELEVSATLQGVFLIAGQVEPEPEATSEPAETPEPQQPETQQAETQQTEEPTEEPTETP